ncbi:T9SS C-terminal target domain-containing protein [Aquimarina sp. BL5]|uniref:T9SS type A sorting domain-containing protein n=1 Tax=Aquimarina sp. BL5 TaxID=1714860 RepID=UPI000E4FA635|nr:T9SS type A sorting domain-containing protein [Aquimarina sp. BL5]AXT50243.1 T9SS C-terminal target domain-containing protein [Aquimarina sp. BL5]RKN09559.1 glycosyl hydrolase family protein [Aquimarina sp. BL5]
MKKINQIFILFVALLLNTNIFSQPPGNINDWQIDSRYSDEFNGNLNKWFVKNTTNEGFLASQVNVSGGKLTISNSWDGTTSKGGWVESVNPIASNEKYGYYEARLRINGPNNGKVWPTFWMWNANANNPTEIDVMEYSGFAFQNHLQRATSSHHYTQKQPIEGRSNSTTRDYSVVQRNAFEEHTWGVLWAKDKIVFFYDGVEYFRSKQPQNAAVDPAPTKIILSSSPHLRQTRYNICCSGGVAYQQDNPLTNANAVGPLASFELQWVRFWRKKPGTSEVTPLPSDYGNGINNAPIGSKIWLKQASGPGKYLSVESGGVLKANQTSNTANKTHFTVESHPANNGIVLKSAATNQYLRITGTNETAPIIATSNNKQAWEKFHWKDRGTNKVSLRSYELDAWVIAPQNQTNPSVTSLAAQPLSWELFDWGIVGTSNPPITNGAPIGSTIGIIPVQASWVNRNGKPALGYISTRFDNNGLVQSYADTNAPTQTWKAWERFNVETHPNGGIALSVQQNGTKYVQHNGTGNLTANATNKNSNDTKFTWEVLNGTRRFALKTATGQYVQVPQNAAGNPILNTSATARGDWEILSYTDVGSSARVNSTNSIKTEADEIFGVKLYPNPVNAGDNVYIDTNSEAIHVAVYNLNGVLLLQGKSSKINTSKLSSGMYLVNLSSNESHKTIKLIIK